MALPSKEQMLYANMTFLEATAAFLREEIAGTKFDTPTNHTIFSCLEFYMKALDQEFSKELTNDKPKPTEARRPCW